MHRVHRQFRKMTPAQSTLLKIEGVLYELAVPSVSILQGLALRAGGAVFALNGPPLRRCYPMPGFVLPRQASLLSRSPAWCVVSKTCQAPEQAQQRDDAAEADDSAGL